MNIQQKFLKKRIIHVTRWIIQGIHQPNSNTRCFAVVLNWGKM